MQLEPTFILTVVLLLVATACWRAWSRLTAELRRTLARLDDLARTLEAESLDTESALNAVFEPQSSPKPQSSSKLAHTALETEENTQQEQERELISVRHQLEATQQELARALDEAHQSNAECEKLEAELGSTERDLQFNRQLYLLIRGVCAEPAMLRERREAVSTLSGTWGAKPPPRTEPEALEAISDEVVEDDELLKDSGHKNAARAARVMVKDLFLYNEHLLKNSKTEAEVKAALKRQYRGARDTFEERVPKDVWQRRDYLKLEFERAVRERIPAGGSREAGNGQPVAHGNGSTSSRKLVDSIEDRRNAARLAQWMLADLILSQLDVVERGVREGNLREALMAPYEAAREEFQARVPERLWKKRHDFELCFEQALSDLDMRGSLESELDDLFGERFKEA